MDKSRKDQCEPTVAVLFAMEFEMSAFRYMLDIEYDAPVNKQPGDSNYYILGQLEGHEIVLAYLPGEQGAGAAARVGQDLSRTFSKIRWRFLVGIGGGVPSQKHDIRLGDVIISMPDSTTAHGGVVQYDLGKHVDDRFRRKGFLAQPPSYLRAIVERMKSDQLLHDSKVPQFVEQMLNRGPRLRKAYQRPVHGIDVLYEEENTDNVSEPQFADRPPRDNEDVHIHYGIIASGNRVVVSTEDRKAIISSVDGDVLCFEMEAAGFASEDPCLVIRGISDYADSYKNKDWQHWAAANAAACTKEILLLVQPEKVQPEDVQSTKVQSYSVGYDNGNRGVRGGSPNISQHQTYGIQHSGPGSFTTGNNHFGNVYQNP